MIFDIGTHCRVEALATSMVFFGSSLISNPLGVVGGSLRLVADVQVEGVATP
jgi:hypothetical protein